MSAGKILVNQGRCVDFYLTEVKCFRNSTLGFAIYSNRRMLGFET